MNPIDTYKHTSARARRLLHLQDGLVNTRRRGIRSDWKGSFNALMHWPKSARIERVDTRQAIVIVREEADLTPADFSKESLDDLLRSSLVMGVSALDRYVHERVIKGIVGALKEPDLNNSQLDFVIPAVLTIQITESVARARRKGQTIRPANEVRKKIQELLHKRPFQSWREVEYAFELIGVTGLFGRLQDRLRASNMKAVKLQLNRIVRRRNEIVHEGDLVKHSRGGRVRCHAISPAFVRESLDFLDEFVLQLDAIK